MKQYEATNWQEIIDCISQAKAAFINPEQIWFRGQSNTTYNLLPSIMRISGAISKEPLLHQKFVQYSFRVFTRQKTDWETLFDMQHYGIPTRLLDWSETLGIALFFAVEYNQNTNAAIYVLDPLELNKYSGITEIPFIPDDKNFDYKSIYWNKKPFSPKYPVAIQPLFQNDRILAQSGMFTVHGDDDHPIELLCSKAVKKIILTQNAISEARDFLQISNINARTVYPDLTGVALHVKKLAGL